MPIDTNKLDEALKEFLGVTFRVKQGGAEPRTEAMIDDGDEVVISQDSQGEYAITVKSRDPELVFAPLDWDKFGNLGGGLRNAQTLAPVANRIVRVSFYEQGGEYPLKVIFGTIIEKDPDSVGAWSADDQDPDEQDL